MHEGTLSCRSPLRQSAFTVKHWLPLPDVPDLPTSFEAADRHRDLFPTLPGDLELNSPSLGYTNYLFMATSRLVADK